MKRTALVSLAFAVVCALLAVTLGRDLTIQEDPVATLRDEDPIRHALFEFFQEKSPFQGRVFVDASELDQPARQAVITALGTAGYVQGGGPAPSTISPLALVPLLPAALVAKRLSDGEIAARVADARAAASLPGGVALLREMERDPFLFGPFLAANLLAPLSPKTRPARIVTFVLPPDAPRPSYAKIGAAYAALEGLRPAIHFVGGDFFAYENYLTVKSDVEFCLLVSIPLNLILFAVFVRRLVFLVLLFVGSAVSYVFGLAAVRLAGTEVYALVLAFTSTFIGFNNEYLVHLSGLDLRRIRRAMIGLGSAIGTTLIGFLVLLPSGSPIIQQMALVSLGGMAGFLAFLLANQKTLATVKVRTLRWPKLRFGKLSLVGIWVTAIAATLLFGVPEIKTSVDAFKVPTPRLDADVAHFQALMPAIDLTDVRAVELGATDPYAKWLEVRGPDSFHPLSIFKPAPEQAPALAVLERDYAPQMQKLAAAFSDAGFRFTFAPEAPAAALAAPDFLRTLEALSPPGALPWQAVVAGRPFLFIARPSADKAPDAVPVSPRRHYDELLTGLGRELGLLFLVGLAVMAVYLIPLQRNFWSVLYIFSPLAVFAALICALGAAFDRSLTVVHFMGFALVIALAVDYTAIAVSSDWHEEEMSKVLLTGLGTVASFGVLCAARHPLLRDLGFVVTAGAGSALIYALLFRFSRKEPHP